jgi:hypothetical protein
MYMVNNMYIFAFMYLQVFYLIEESPTNVAP